MPQVDSTMTSQQVKDIVDHVLVELQTRKREFGSECINWGDLRCADAIDLGDGSWLIDIEEVAQEAWQFRVALENAIAERGITARVITNW